MSDVSTFDAALIGGGRSRRFGDDKAFLEWRGQPLYQRQLDTLRELEPNRLWLSTNSDQDFPSIEGIERVIDEQSDLGPIGGLLSVFRKSEADQILVLGVDLPLMTSDFLRHLVEQGSGTIAKSERYWEPLVGFYKRLETLQLLETAVAETDLKLQALLNRAESKGIARALPFEESEKILFTNLNTPHDLSAIDPNRFDDTISLKRFHRSSGLAEADDFVAAEEPLEVRVNGQSVSVMMRTPGHDEELATGFLFTESVIQSTADIREIKHLDDVDRSSSGNTLEIELESEPDLTDLTRHVFTSSSCGVCGKATIDSVFQQFPPIQEAKSVSPDLILALPDRLRAAQKTFDRTGGLHASALFSQEGKLLVLREDVGRHNALDKVIGFGLQGKINFSEVVLLVSGRISFELMQKSLSVGIPTVAGISAPSSLAVTLANESGQTLVGFLRGEGFNLYSGSLG